MRRWPVVPVMAGAVAGFVAGLWWGRAGGGRDPRGAGEAPDDLVDEGWADRWGERVDAAMEAAAGGLRAVGDRWRGLPPLDEAELQAVVAGVPGATGLEARPLGTGLVELVGDASDAGASAAAAALRAHPGVRVVVNRAWTPSSLRPGQIDDLPGFG